MILILLLHNDINKTEHAMDFVKEVSCFSPSLSHRQDIPLGHVKGRGVAFRVGVVFK